VQVYGCRERHLLPRFIVNLLPNLQTPPTHGDLCAKAQKKGGAMPRYEYLCPACSKKFSIVLTIAEHEKGEVKCPKCGSAKVEQQWAAFYATTSKKS